MSTRAAARARSAPAPAREAPAPPRPRPAAAPPRTRPAARGARRPARSAPRARVNLRSAAVVIPLIALLLAGIVSVNVATLSLTKQTGQVIQRARSVESETARLKATLEVKEASVRRRAERRLGMVAPATGSVGYLDPSLDPGP